MRPQRIQSCAVSNRPTTGPVIGTVGRYLPDIILGANDGIITTFAVVSGVVGASLSSSVILILGFANLLADGFSMGASNVLSRRSRTQNEALPTLAMVSRHGLATIIGFVVAGLIPLLAYCVPVSKTIQFEIAVMLSLSALFVVGASRATFIGRSWLTSGLEMLILGGVAALIAYAVGAAGAAIIHQIG